MNYRHLFHAGNICDTVKHALLIALIDHLHTKPAPFVVFDTHAGTGSYDLTSPEAQKTSEAAMGIQRLATADPAALQDYLKTIRDANGGSAPPWKFYPGSCRIAANRLRPQDRLVACELHPEDYRALRRSLRDKPRAQLHHRDGYEALLALTPPPEKRGIALIDPPFEQANDWQKLVATLQMAHAKWPQGIYALWYPIKDRPTIWAFHDALIATGIRQQLLLEFLYQEESCADRLNGSGMIIVNPPWQFQTKAEGIFSALSAAYHLAPQAQKIGWLVEA